MSKWDERFMELARLVSTWSKDPSTKVGAVIVNPENHVVSLGFNGFPRGIKDDERLEDRETKYAMILHAEVNALQTAVASVKDCTVYTWPLPPCSRCAAQLIQAGIKRVVIPEGVDERWVESCSTAFKMFDEAEIPVIKVDIPVEV